MAAIDPDAAIAAAAASHRSWHAAQPQGSARTLAGGLVCAVPGRDGRHGELQVLFVDPGADPAAVVDDVLDQVDALRPLRGIGWWATDTSANATLGVSLLARGFQWGWQPTWMAMDPADLTLDTAGPPDVAIHTASADGATAVFHAVEGEAVVGHIVLHAGPATVAGIYDTWVVEGARRRGIGGALTATAVTRARDLGCSIVTLNATSMGEPVYRRAGFARAGSGQTWWMAERQMSRPRATPESVRLVEAIGLGDLEALDAAIAGSDLDAELLCGLTPIGVAIQFRQPEAAKALVRHGARLDVVSAWDLGWRQTAARLLRDHPGLANLRTGDMGLTPLHVAVDRDDEDLARLVLAAGPDLSIRDRQYRSDALGWAIHLERRRIAELVRAAAAERAG